MKKLIYSLSIVAASIFFLTTFTVFNNKGMIAYAGNDDVATEIKSLENDLAKIEQERSAAQKALNAAKNSKATQMSLKRQYDSEIEALESLLQTTEALIGEYDESIAESEKEIESLGEELEQQHITPTTVRLSIGVEHIDDILADLSQAFDKI